MLLAALCSMALVGDPPSVGEPFPPLEFTQWGTSERVTLEEFAGTRVLLIQFASW